MDLVLLFLIPLFTIFANDGSGLQEYGVFQTDNTELWCDHSHADACVALIGDYAIVIVEDPFKQTRTGGNQITHEWYHLMGYEENEIPKTRVDYIPDYMRDYLNAQP